MASKTILAFDHVMTSTGAPVTEPSPSRHNAMLGTFDQIIFEAITDLVFGTAPFLKVAIWHSADGVHWLPKSASPEMGPQALSTTDVTNCPAGYDDGTKPNLRFVKFMVELSGSGGAQARVRIHASLSDVRDSALLEELAANDEVDAKLNAQVFQDAAKGINSTPSAGSLEP